MFKTRLKGLMSYAKCVQTKLKNTDAAHDCCTIKRTVDLSIGTSTSLSKLYHNYYDNNAVFWILLTNYLNRTKIPFLLSYGRGITSGIDNNPRHYSKFHGNPINQSCGHQNSKVFEIVHNTRYYFVITCVI